MKTPYWLTFAKKMSEIRHLWFSLAVFAAICVPKVTLSMQVCTLKSKEPDGSMRYVPGYVNYNGICVPLPEERSNDAGMDATAQCRDRSYSFSQHIRGTCNNHGGVLRWINRPAK